MSEDSGLNSGLKQRHMTLIAIGGTIGAGLFVGSGVVIHAAGPAALISFLLAGVLIMLVMRMLGEMAVARPAVGSFYEYARIGLGDWAGFVIGWLYLNRPRFRDWPEATRGWLLCQHRGSTPTSSVSGPRGSSGRRVSRIPSYRSTRRWSGSVSGPG